ncbi:MAG: hypothetical protein HOY78_18755 [Saccharothrix sp.]|nr:hypothetical protein [Saccharothrix sp.]
MMYQGKWYPEDDERKGEELQRFGLDPVAEKPEEADEVDRPAAWLRRLRRLS